MSYYDKFILFFYLFFCMLGKQKLSQLSDIFYHRKMGEICVYNGRQVSCAKNISKHA